MRVRVVVDKVTNAAHKGVVKAEQATAAQTGVGLGAKWAKRAARGQARPVEPKGFTYPPTHPAPPPPPLAVGSKRNEGAGCGSGQARGIQQTRAKARLVLPFNTGHPPLLCSNQRQRTHPPAPSTLTPRHGAAAASASAAPRQRGAPTATGRVGTDRHWQRRLRQYPRPGRPTHDERASRAVAGKLSTPTSSAQRQTYDVLSPPSLLLPSFLPPTRPTGRQPTEPSCHHCPPAQPSPGRGQIV